MSTPIVAGRLYRAVQLSETALTQVITSYSIRVILNLRVATPGARWDDCDVAVAQSRGVAYYAYMGC
jgi:hypothetical protein